jgi:hypothetical protein
MGSAESLPATNKYNAAIWQSHRKSRPIAARLGLADPLDDLAWFTLFILAVRQRGRSGGNGPLLYHQHVEGLGEALPRVARGDRLFQEQLVANDQLAGA